MRAEIYPIDDVPSGRLAIAPRPRAGDWLAGEIESWRQAGINCVVSLLESAEIAELELQREGELCQQMGLEFLHFPIPDRGVPHARDELTALVQSLVKQLLQGRGVVIHCRIGVGRSAMVAACVLATLSQPVESAFRSIQAARRMSVPDTPEQREWVTNFCTE